MFTGVPMFRVLTVEREYGSGGSAIARIVAETLGWRLLDRALVTAVARTARVDAATVSQYDERIDSWWHRFHRDGLRAAAIHGGVQLADAEVFDTETVATITRAAISDAHDSGDCVIVGRGAQCILQGHDDVFHVFIYGPWSERVSRIRSRTEPTGNIGKSIRCTDDERASYIRTCYGCDWKDPHLYNMMISSHIGIEDAAWMIVEGVLRGGPVPLSSAKLA